MKKILFSILLVTFGFFFYSYVNAQEANDRKIRFGLRAAPSAAWLKPELPTVKTDGLAMRFMYGLVFDYRFADNFWFGTGLDVTYLGGKIAYANNCQINNLSFPNGWLGYTPIVKSNYTAQFLELPLTVKMKTKEIGSIIYFAQVGLNPGFRLDTKVKHDLTGLSMSKYKSLSDVHFMRVAVNISSGVEYNLTGTTSLLLGVSYNNGFTNLFKNPSQNIQVVGTTNSLLNLNVRSNYIALNVGFLF